LHGAIVAPAEGSAAALKPLTDIGTPIVIYDRQLFDDTSADTVLCDNAAATRQATEHLVFLGHERIAFVGGRTNVETGAERLAGYTEAMRAAGLTPFSVNGGFRAELAACAAAGARRRRARRDRRPALGRTR